MSELMGVPDRMRYNLKVTAVESTNKLTTGPCNGTDTYAGGTSSTIEFTIPHSSMNEFVDPVMSRFRFQLQVYLPQNMINNPAKDSASAKEVIHLDRGFESLIRRIDIYDMNGNLLEAIDHYNCLYAITELCTSEPETRKSRGRFTLECLQPEEHASGCDLWPDQQFQTLATKQSSNQQDAAPRLYEVCFNLISGVFGGTCEKYWPLKAINGLRILMQLENPSDAFVYRFLPSTDEKRLHLPKGPAHPDNINPDTGGFAADIIDAARPNNGQRYVFGGNSIGSDAAVTEWGTTYVGTLAGNTKSRIEKTHFDTQSYQVELNPSSAMEFGYAITKPCIQLNRIYLPGGMGDSIIGAAKAASPDGKIRIQTHSWKVLTSQIYTTQNSFDYIIPIQVASLKAVFFTITPQSNTANINRSKTQFIQRGMTDYQFFYSDDPVLNQPVKIQYPNTEAYAELMRAWNVAHKTMDAPTLITVEDYNENCKVNDLGFFQNPSSCVFGIDLESFAAKNNVMDSGINTRNAIFRIVMNFRAATTRDTVEWGAACTVRFYCLHDMFLSINDMDGTVINEF